MTPVIGALGGNNAVEATALAIQDVGRWWLLSPSSDFSNQDIATVGRCPQVARVPPCAGT